MELFLTEASGGRGDSSSLWGEEAKEKEWSPPHKGEREKEVGSRLLEEATPRGSGGKVAKPALLVAGWGQVERK